MQKNMKIFNIDGKNMRFDSDVFNRHFTEQRKKKKISVLDYEIEIGEALSVSSSAVNNWRFSANGPSDIERIKQLAYYIGIRDYKLLLKETKENTVMEISERQKDSLKHIYDAVIEYLDKFMMTNGFNDYWIEFVEDGVKSSNVEERLYEIAKNELHKVELVLSKEYIELHKLPIYSELEEYVFDDLCETYDGKLSYAYRFEAMTENIDGTRNSVTTSEDYDRAIKKINCIMEVYM